MNKKTYIATFLLLVFLAGCSAPASLPGNTITPTRLPTISPTVAVSTSNPTTPAITSTTRPRLITTTPFPFPANYRWPTFTLTPKYGPEDAQIERLLPDSPSVSGASFIDAEHGWVLFSGTFLYQTKDGGSSWIELPHLTQTFSAIDFVSQTRGWATSDDGLYLTDNGGRNWERILDGPLYWYQTVMDFVSETDGFLYRQNGLNRTTDGGKTWSVLHPEAFANLYRGFVGSVSISFISQLKGWVLYQECNAPVCHNRLFKTEDGGETFHMVTETSLGIEGTMNWMRPGHEIFFLDDNRGWFVGGQYGYQWTEDGGKIWKSAGLGGLSSINHIKMLNSNDGVAASQVEYGGLVKTRDGGKTWLPVMPSLRPDRLVRFLDAEHGYGAGGFLDSAALLVTNDGGKSWEKVGKFPKPIGLLQLLNAKVAWAGRGEFPRSDQDFLWKTEDGGKTWKEILLPKGFQLQNFFFSDQDTGIAWDNKNNAFRTLNGGKTWRSLIPGKFDLPIPAKVCAWQADRAGIYRACPGESGWSRVLSMNYVDRFIPVSEKDAWVFGQKEEKEFVDLLRTTDGGKTWEPVKTGRAYFSDVDFIDMKQGWAIAGFSLIKTTDGGDSWQQIPPGNMVRE